MARIAGSPSTSGRPPRRALIGTLGRNAARVAEALATPLVPADYLDLISPMRASADLRGRIVAIRPETADAATIVIRPGRAWKRHVPGQYIRIGIQIDGVRHWRPYSLTCRTGEPDGTISITTKAIPDGLVSNHLVRRARPGTLVMLDQATGEFTLGETPPPRALFITAGSGITPVMGMLRNHELADAVMINSAPTPEDVIFGDELRALDDAGRLRLTQLHTDSDGMLDLARDLDRLVPDWRERETWACGPTALLDACEQHWEQAGLAEALHTERFRPSIVEAGEGGTVTFTESDVTVEADGGTTLLDLGEQAGIVMPCGCRMGICYGCVSQLRSGAVRDLRDGAITTAEGEDGTVHIQTCISAAAGPCEIVR